MVDKKIELCPTLYYRHAHQKTIIHLANISSSKFANKKMSRTYRQFNKHAQTNQRKQNVSLTVSI